ncbi:hypothetical protein AWJ20_745 [Sugiyamaella lignohabitans]|uniref:DUF7719 domain-containing protein n=1 Tax=Sugiyamaella lignohabitans TaxID=796027 RepID=A0A167D509_9ASCO|nr:uncharacterized protein AWJ20_745 [Sugiyamaella lignohabitans]ANB12489.1 hypothetical protein AWJ20_745 [Sugiyamaella lignohabitans]
MPPRTRKQKQNKQFPTSAKITELDSLQDFSDYVGQAEIPAETLVDHIQRVQGQYDAKTKKTGSRSNDLPPNIKRTTVPSAKSRATRSPDEASTAITEDDLEDLSGVAKFMFTALDYTMYLIPLLAINIVLNVLVRAQYGQEVDSKEIVAESLTTIPVMTIVHAVFHPYKSTRVFRIVSFFTAVAIGGYILYTTHEEGYYAVMKRAPPLGTLWVWLFLEMDWEWAATCLVVIAFWMWKQGYSL